MEPITAPLRPHSAVSGAGGVRTTNQQTSNSSSLVEAPSSSSSKGGGGTFSSSGHHKRSTSSGAQHHLHHPQRCEINFLIHSIEKEINIFQMIRLTTYKGIEIYNENFTLKNA